RLARVGNDELATTIARLPEITGHNREAFADISANREDAVGMEHIADRVGGAVDTQRTLVRTRRRRHTQPPVVIAMAGAQGNARKLSGYVALLVSHRRTAVDGNGIFAMLGLKCYEALRNRIERLVPGGALQRAIFATPSHQRIKQTIRMV